MTPLATLNRKGAATVAMVGTFPPPIHGMAVVNAVINERLRAYGVHAHVINLSAPNLDRKISQRLGRIPRIILGFITLSKKSNLRKAKLYISVSGGLGKVFELAFVVLARSRGMQLILHHHSFAYLRKPSILAGFLISLSGSKSIHVVQSSLMAKKLKRHYHVREERTLPLSNAAWIDDSAEVVPPREKVQVIGFLSNLSKEKGIFEFIRLCEAIDNLGWKIRAKLAGPFQDAETERYVRDRLRHIPWVEYLGGLYGVEKSTFYASIDAFIFPTLYVNETEGLVGLEALQRGVPVIAFGRGAIPEYVNESCGHVVDVTQDFTRDALQCLKRWRASPPLFRETSLGAREQFAAVKREADSSWEQLKTLLTS